MSDGKSGRGGGRNGTDQHDPWDLFSFYIILVIFQVISIEGNTRKTNRHRIVQAGGDLRRSSSPTPTHGSSSQPIQMVFGKTPVCPCLSCTGGPESRHSKRPAFSRSLVAISDNYGNIQVFWLGLTSDHLNFLPLENFHKFSLISS